MELKDKKCIPCSGDIPPLGQPEKEKLLHSLKEKWTFTHDSTRLFIDFKFKNFVEAMSFAQAVGILAEEQFHHPELHVGYKHCGVEIWTHKINNLVESDFILAAKIEALFLTRPAPKSAP